MLENHSSFLMPDENCYSFTALSGACVKRVLKELERPPHSRRVRGLARFVHLGPNVPGLVAQKLIVVGLLIFL